VSRISFAVTILVLFCAVVALSVFALQMLFVSGPGNEGSTEATQRKTQATQTTEETTAYGEETTAYGEETTAYQEETTVLQGEDELEAPPDSTLSFGGNEVRVSVSASYCWSTANGGGCFDGVSTIPPRKQTLHVPSGSEMVFRYEAPRPPKKVSVSAASFDEGWFMGEPAGSHRSLKAHGSGVEKKAKGQTSFLWTIPAELPPGEYGVYVYVTDPQGDPHYVFRVMVE
jgi:hypothetical protein